MFLEASLGMRRLQSLVGMSLRQERGIGLRAVAFPAELNARNDKARGLGCGQVLHHRHGLVVGTVAVAALAIESLLRMGSH